MQTVEFGRLVRHLTDEQTPLSVAQLYRLSDISGEELDQFHLVWSRIPVKRRRRILGFLLEIAENNFEVDFEPVFRICLGDPDEKVRARSVAGLWESEDESLIAPLVEVIRNDLSMRTRIAATSGLGRFVQLGELGHLSRQRQREVEEILLALIRSPEEDPEVKRRAVEALAYSSREEIPGIIESAYYHEERLMRVTAVFAMGRSLDPQWEPLLLDELRSHDAELCYEAARACGELELASAVSRLAELLAHEDREVQEVAIWSLGQIGGRKARQVLEAHHEAAGQDDEALREATEEALSELALNSGAIQFPLYEYRAEAEGEIRRWDEDWLNGVLADVLNDEGDEMAHDELNDD